MRISKAMLKNRGVIVTVAVASLVVGYASPVAASPIAGVGAGTGWEYPNNLSMTPTPCPNGTGPLNDQTTDILTSTRYEISHTGTYTNVGPGATAQTYVGPSTVTVMALTHAISPVGTHDAAGDCVLPEAIPITATVHGTVTGGSIHCNSNTGTYIRAQSVVTFTFSGECALDGNVVDVGPNPKRGNTQHLLQGTSTPCSFFPEACDAGAIVNPPSMTPPGAFYEGTYQAVALT